MLDNMLIIQKIRIAMVLLITILVLVMSGYYAYADKQLIEQVAIEKANTLVESYFDNLNTLMMTGGIGESNLARDKILAKPQVTSAKVVRSEALIKSLNKPLSDVVTPDRFEAVGLTGERL